MDVAEALVAGARAAGAASLAVVGTSKNAGKSVVVAAVAEALARTREPFGICSIGRDGEAIDAIESTPKPRFVLRPGALFATAEALVPRSPACEILAVTGERSALGAIVIARVRAVTTVEIAGPPTATAVRRVVAALAGLARFVVIDGAVDRIAALRGGRDAIVVATGAASAPTIARAAEDAAALVARLRVPQADAMRAAVRVTGALTAARAARFANEGEGRQIVVDDPTQIAFGGRAFLELAARIDLRCEHPLLPIACTVAPMWSQRAFAPAAFARAVAERTGLPAYDAYAGTQTLPGAA
jgi:hypothetical protein